MNRLIDPSAKRPQRTSVTSPLVLNAGMDTFRPQPDEGYSEDPLNPTSAAHPSSASEMPDWLTAQLPQLPLSVKKSACTHPRG